MIKLVKSDEKAVRRNYSNVREIVEEFADSDFTVGEVVFTKDDYCSAESAYSSFYQSIKRCHRDSIKASVRRGHLFLVKV